MNEAMNYDDYIKLRDAKVGDTVKLSDGRIITKTVAYNFKNAHRSKPSKYQNLDFYDHTYEG